MKTAVSKYNRCVIFVAINDDEYDQCSFVHEQRASTSKVVQQVVESQGVIVAKINRRKYANARDRREETKRSIKN